MQLKYFSIVKAYRDYVITDSLISLGNSFELPALIKRVGWRLVMSTFPRSMKHVNRMKSLHNFGRYLLIMTKRHGSTYTVQYLKTSQLALQRAIAGQKVSSPRELSPDLNLPRYSRCGLPRIIPRGDRRAIGAGSTAIIRY